MHVWTFSCQPAILVCLLAIFSHLTLHLLTFLLLSHWLSRLCGAKYVLPFLLSFICGVFGFVLPLLFSWEMAEAVFREGLEDLMDEENIYGSF